MSLSQDLQIHEGQDEIGAPISSIGINTMYLELGHFVKWSASSSQDTTSEIGLLH